MKPVLRHYRWQTTDAQGQAQSGIVSASNIELARAQLLRQGVHAPVLHRQWWPPHTAGISSRQLSTLTQQWATLLRAGISLAPSLQMLERSTPVPHVAQVLHQVRMAVEAGQPLSEALAKHPRHFSHLYVSMVHAGETAGILDSLMARLALTLEKNHALQARVRSALTYPAVVFVLALVVLALMLVFVVPVFEDVFHTFGAELPLSTRLVVGMSQQLNAHATWMALAALATWAYGHHRSRDPAWRRRWQRRWLALPVLGDMLRSAIVSRWAHTLAALLEAGVPLVEALPTAGQACAHPLYGRLSEHLQRRVAQGGRLSEGMAHTGRFPDLLVQLCATGEETGTLSTLLARAAQLMEQELDARVNSLSSVIEPIIVVFMGAVIGGILVAMYLPIFRLGQVF